MELERKCQILLLSEDRKSEAIGVDFQLLGLLVLFMKSGQLNSSVTISSNVTFIQVPTIYQL